MSFQMRQRSDGRGRYVREAKVEGAIAFLIYVAVSPFLRPAPLEYLPDIGLALGVR